MSVVREWERCLPLLESKSVKERSEAVSHLREIVSTPRALNTLCAQPGLNWLKPLQAMFALVKAERNLAVSTTAKSTAAASKRLADAAALVALTITKLHRTQLTKKAVKASLAHLTQMIFIRGKLQSFALPYLRALRSVLGFEAHVEHLDEADWADIVQLGFAAILGDDVKIGNDFAEEIAMDIGNEDDSDGNVPRATALRRGRRDDIGSDDELLDSPARGAGGKRKSHASQVDIELIGCVEAVFRSTSANFIPYASVILAKFVRLLKLFKGETSAHLPTLGALNIALSHLALNDNGAMNTYALQLWPYLFELWQTKNVRLKEQLLVALRWLFPFIASPSTRQSSDRATETALVTLYEAVLSEPTIRWREGYELDVDSLALGPTSDASSARIFTRQTFAAGQAFTDRHAAAWATLELGADALVSLHALAEKSHRHEPTEPHQPTLTSIQGRAKRRKVQDRLDGLLDALLTTAAAKTAPLEYYCQLLLFVVDGHWHSFHFELCQRITAAAILLCSHAGPALQSWAFLLTAAISREPFPAAPAAAWAASSSHHRAESTSAAGAEPDWDLLWSSCVRRLSQPEVCRAAAHTATVLISHGRVSPTALTTSIETLAAELDVQGPQFPSETVCSLFEWLIATAEDDMSLFRLGLPDKVLAWLVAAWKPLAGTARGSSFGQARQHRGTDPLSVESLARLIARICAFEKVPAELGAARYAFVPDCAVASQAVELAETGPISDFIQAKIPSRVKPSSSARNDDDESPWSIRPLARNQRTGQEAAQRKTQARLTTWLVKTLDKLLADADGDDGAGEPALWAQMTEETVRRHLDLACLVLVTDGLLQLNGGRSSLAAVKSATVVLERLAPVVAARKWPSAERLFIAQGFNSILAPLPDYAPVQYPVLLEPGSASGLPRHLVNKGTANSVELNLDSVQFQLLRIVWGHGPTKAALGELTRALRQTIDQNSKRQSPAPTQTLNPESASAQAGTHRMMDEFDDDDDDFGVITDGTKANAAAGGNERAQSEALSYAVRAIVSLAMAGSNLARPARISDFIQSMCELDGESFIALLETLCAAKRAGLCEWRVAECALILHHLGAEIMPKYAFARSERVALVGLKFLACTASSWILGREDGSADEWEVHAREFLGWYTHRLSEDKLLSYRVRLRLAELVDAYLAIDSTQTRWDLNGAVDGLAILPSALLPLLLGDVDFRVKFRAATSSAALFSFVHDNGLNDEQLFADIRREAGDTDVGNFERTLTGILCSLNIIINSATRRRGPYNLSLQIGGTEARYSKVIQAGLQGVVERLGLPSLSSLYEFYMRYLASNRARSAASLAELTAQAPPALCGYGSAREQRQADFAVVGAQVLIKEGVSDSFASLSQTMKLTPAEGVLRVFAETAALIILKAFQNSSADPNAQLLTLATEAGAADQDQAENVIGSYADEIGLTILSMLHQDRWRAGPPPALERADASAGRVFTELTRIEGELSVRESVKPSFDLETVSNALDWFNHTFQFLLDPAPLYSALQKLLDLIEQAPFVDSQRQLLLALATAIALAYRVVRSSAPLLAAIAQKLVTLVGRLDLTVLVAPMLEWSIKQWVQLGSKSTDGSAEGASEVIVKALSACQLLDNALDEQADLYQSVGRLPELAAHLRRFLEQALQACSQSSARDAALLNPYAAEQSTTAPLTAIKQLITSPSARLAQFNLVQSLIQRADFSTDPARAELVWRLLETADPHSTAPHAEDCIALAEAVYQTSGEIEPPPLKEMDTIVDANGLRPAVVESEDRLKMAVLAKLLNTIDAANQSLTADIFDAVRNIFSLPASKNEKPWFNEKLLSNQAAAVAALLRSQRLLKPGRVRRAKPRSLEELEQEKWTTAPRDFRAWVTKFAALLADARAHDEPFYAQLVPLVSSSAQIAAKLLPELVHSLLIEGALAGELFSPNSLSAYFQTLLTRTSSSAPARRECLASLVECAVYLRNHPVPRMTALEPDPTSSDRWLSLKWIDLAQAGCTTGAYLAALLFLELGHEYDGLFADDSDNPVDHRAQELLYDIYAHVDEPDGFYGRQAKEVRQAVIRRYRHEGRWAEAFGAYGAQFESESSSLSAARLDPSGGLVQSLASSGFSRLATSVLQSVRTDSATQSGLSYELAWRTDTWDLPVEPAARAKSSVALYSALKAVRAEPDNRALMRAVTNSVKQEARKLAQVSVNWPRPSKEVIATLLALREVAAFRELIVIDNDNSEGRLDPAAVKRMVDVPSEFRFEHAEKMLATRVSLLRAVRAREQVNQIGDELSPLAADAAAVERACLLKLSSIARATSGKLQTALNSVTLAHKLVQLGTADLEVDHELANVLWAQGEHATAIQLLRDVQRQQPVPQSATLVQLGEWTAEARLKSSREISEDYFAPAIDALANDGAGTEQRAQVHAAFARFADGEYSEFEQIAQERKKRYTAYQARKVKEFEEIELQLQQQQSVSSLNSSNAASLDRQRKRGQADLEDDKKLVDEAEATAKFMLWSALENFAHAIKLTSKEHDDKVFRFCALWLANAADDRMHAKLGALLKAIPSAKFVFLAYQLSARLAKEQQPTAFGKNVSQLVERLAVDHPFHVLFAVHALRTDAADSSKGRGSRRSSTQHPDAGGGRGPSARALAANEIFSRVKQRERLVERAEAIELACEAYSEWASWDLRRDPAFADDVKGKGALKKPPFSRGYQLPSRAKIRSKLIDLPIPVSTVDLPIDPTATYRSGSYPSLHKYDGYFSTAGGVNIPKIMACFDSSGQRHKQLLKGGDDIRQDAVMEQAFVLINTLLARDDASRTRGLHIRTYKVIPLQNRTGLIEFVADTRPIGDVMAQLYKKYRPHSLSPAAARTRHRQVQNGSRQEQVKVYKELLCELPPVMRYAFLDQHKLPALWFEMRTAYARSLATTSIIGHIVGLGDRHVSNILIDTSRGELVPIDLGIAFDQGRRLPIPELVPFRLTPNLIDGLGMHKIEGVFRHCAQHTLRVLREQARVLMTVLSVFKHDPLQTWAVSAHVAAKIQGEQARGAGGGGAKRGDVLDELPDDADRALAIVAAKLDKSLSVEYRVNQLVTEATNPENLAAIFCGWQPCL